MIIVDTGGLYAYLDTDDAHHEAARAIVDHEPGPFVTSPFVLAELDYLVLQRLGGRAELQLIRDVSDGVYRLVPFDSGDVTRAADLMASYRSLEIGLTDASVAVLAARYRTTKLLSVDGRHFRAIRPLQGGAFELPILDWHQRGR